MPGLEYRAHSGQQGTWEVSFLGQHVAKRSFQKYDGEDGAATQVLWEAWRHHARRTGQACQVPWLVAKFDFSDTGAEARQSAAVAADSTPLAALAVRGSGRGRRGSASTAEPSASSSGLAGGTAEPANPGKKQAAKQASKRTRSSKADRAAPKKRTRKEKAAAEVKEVAPATPERDKSPAASSSGSSSDSDSSSRSGSDSS